MRAVPSQPRCSAGLIRTWVDRSRAGFQNFQRALADRSEQCSAQVSAMNLAEPCDVAPPIALLKSVTSCGFQLAVVERRRRVSLETWSSYWRALRPERTGRFVSGKDLPLKVKPKRRQNDEYFN